MRPTRLLLAAAVATLSAGAAAQDNPARRLFEEARTLMLEGQFERACPKLEESQLLAPRLGTLVNLAACHERLGKTATAWVEYQQARDMAREDQDPERERFAEGRIEVLAPRVPWLTVALPDAPAAGFAVGVDGVPIDPERWGDPMPIDPGVHVVVAAAPDHQPRELRVRIAEAERRTLRVAKLEPIVEPPALKPQPKPKPKPEVSPLPPVEPEDEGRRWVLEIGAFAGYLTINPDYTSTADEVVFQDMGQLVSCDGVNCEISIGTPIGGAAIGLNLFAGYQFSDDFDFGGRVVIGPRVGGGLVGGVGPAALLRIGGPLWLGFGALVGGASFVSAGEVSAPSLGQYQNTDIEGTVGIAFGPQLELALHLAEGEQGALSLHTTPFFLLGTEGGTVFAAPLGVAYRFQ